MTKQMSSAADRKDGKQKALWANDAMRRKGNFCFLVRSRMSSGVCVCVCDWLSDDVARSSCSVLTMVGVPHDGQTGLYRSLPLGRLLTSQPVVDVAVVHVAVTVERPVRFQGEAPGRGRRNFGAAEENVFKIGAALEALASSLALTLSCWTPEVLPCSILIRPFCLR